jgi:quinol monooxygenase YgiN
MSRQLMAPVFALPFLFACASDDPEPSYTVHVHGTLAQSSDLAAAQSFHDGTASAVEANLRSAGDFAHHVLLGTAYAGTQVNEFLAIDRWRDTKLADVQAVYADPAFQQAVAPLYAAPPSVRVYERREDWHSWGESGGETGPYWFVTVEGRLARETVDANQDAHDAVAKGNEALANAAGDIAHLPHLGVDDPRAFFNIDVWASEQGMLQTFGDPNFQAQFLALFEGPPTVHIYHSTSWHQWYQP